MLVRSFSDSLPANPLEAKSRLLQPYDGKVTIRQTFREKARPLFCNKTWSPRLYLTKIDIFRWKETRWRRPIGKTTASLAAQLAPRRAKRSCSQSCDQSSRETFKKTTPVSRLTIEFVQLRFSRSEERRVGKECR